MTALNEWAARHLITQAALDDLRRVLTLPLYVEPHPRETGNSEASVQALVRLQAAQRGCCLWRNNVGAVGRLRFGLANDSTGINRVIKSSDLIGIQARVITPEMVGTVIGQFVARECKSAGWVYRGTAREKAQLKFIEIVNGYGGDAAFVTGVD